MQFRLNFVLFLITIGLLSSCTEPQPKSGEAVFKAHINGGAGMTVFMQNLDPFDSETDTFNVDASGTLLISKKLNQPDYFNVIFLENRSSFILFLHPGDTLFLDADLQTFATSRKYSGNGAIYNNYLTSYLNSSNKFQQSIQKVFSQTEEIAVAAMDSVRAANTKVLDDLKANNSDIDARFVKFEEARILYEWALLHNIYPMYYKYFTKMSDFKTSPEYTNYLAECNLNDTSLLSLDMYRIFLTTYVGYKMEEYYADPAIMQQNPSAILYRLQLIDKTFDQPKIKELMAYESVKGHLKERGIEEYDLYYDTYKKLCSNPKFLEETDAIVADEMHLRKGAPAYNFSFVDIDGNTVSMSDFKGKYVYVDVWATWCAPCKAEIPYLKKLEEDFHGKNIVFVSISVDQTQDPWRNMVGQEKLQGVQLWGGLAQEFSQFYKIEGIPRFMLFDKEGNILEAKAKRPSGGIEQDIAALPGL